jgi:Holliday junction resolvase
MRRRARVDANHREIVKALRSVGASVLSLAALGAGCPDILVGFGGATYLLEVKSPHRSAGRNLRERISLRDQAEWRARWRGGPALVVSSVAEALAAVRVDVPPDPALYGPNKFLERAMAPEIQTARKRRRK